MALVSYELKDSIATITMDDGKMNALSPDMFAGIAGAFDRAESDGAVVLLTGRPGVFSAGFDLRVLRGGGPEASKLVRTGFDLAARILAFPGPVVVAVPGHAIAMGLFLAQAGDYRVGTLGPHRIGANEVAIGITMPFFGVEMCRQRLAPAYFHRAVINAEIFSPEEAVTAGFLDRAVPTAELQDTAHTAAVQLSKLDRGVHTATKLRARAHALMAVRAAIEEDAVSFFA